MQKKQWFWGIVAAVVVIDQLTKWWVRTTPELHREVLIEGWLRLNLTSNPGMAMGISWAPTWVISLIAITASAAIIWYAFSLLRIAPLGFMMAMGLIIGGAFGNILDRLYMGYVDGYGGLLSGHVVDFIYFDYVWPDGMPWVGGSVAFPYIFNIADVAISVAVIALIGGAKWLLPPETSPQKGEQYDSFDQQSLPSIHEEDREEPASHKAKEDQKELEKAIARQQKTTASQEFSESGPAAGAGAADSRLSPPAEEWMKTKDVAAHIVEQVEKATQQTEALKRAARGEQAQTPEVPAESASSKKKEPGAKS
ncbi:MAG: signal peptidase II [Cyclonatronaceae bacterium]